MGQNGAVVGQVPYLYMISLHSNKEKHCNKNGAKWSSSWPGTLFWPIPLGKNQQKGCQKG